MSKKKENIPKSECSEIVKKILGAKNKKEQLKIEADLHLTSVTTIKEILKEAGVNLKIFNGGSHKKKHVEDKLTETNEIITPVEEIKAAEDQAEPDEIGQAWADLAIPPYENICEPKENSCEPKENISDKKIPYTKPEILEEPPLPKSSESDEGAAKTQQGEYASADDVLFVGLQILEEAAVFDAIKEKINKLIARRRGLVAEIGHIDVVLKRYAFFYEDIYQDMDKEGIDI